MFAPLSLGNCLACNDEKAVSKKGNGQAVQIVEKILWKFEHFDCKLVSTPYDPSSHLKKNREHSVAQIEYAQITKSLMYLMIRSQLVYQLIHV